MESDTHKPATVEPEKPKKSRVGLYSFLVVIAAASIFSSGWLFGTGRISLRSDNIVSVVTNQRAPTEGID